MIKEYNAHNYQPRTFFKKLDIELKEENIRDALESDINRAEKLKSILFYLGIVRLDDEIYSYDITTEKMQEFINRRNKLYNVSGKELDGSLEKRTIQLMNLCLEIINAIISSSNLEP